MYVLSVVARCAGAIFVPVFFVLLIFQPAWLQRAVRPVDRLIMRLGRHPVRLAIGIGTGTFIFNALLSLLSFWPIPSVHDEFAYILTGDTFAHGRLTNPKHPFSEHFASWHIIQTPSYQAKYPPAQGLFLALGQRVFREPLVGVWFSLAVALSVSVWPCFQWLRPRWAVVASLLLALNPHIHLRWGQSYWGGAVALAAGALVIGALGRMRRRFDWIGGLAGGLGLVLLASSRPFEGLVMAIPVCFFAAWKLVMDGRMATFRQKTVFVATALLVLLLGTLVIGQYNRAVTGRWSKLPYRAWLEQQGETLDRILTPSVIPLKTVSAESPPHRQTTDPAQTPATGSKNDWRVLELAKMMNKRKAIAFEFKRHKLWQLLEFYLQSLLWLPLLALPFALTDQWKSVLCVTVVAVLAGSCTHLSAGHPHYIAGIATALIIIVVTCIRRLSLSPIAGKRFGLSSIVCLLFAWTTIFGLNVVADVVEQPRAPRLEWAHRRQILESKLSSDDHPDVVFVKYLPGHSIHQEWVYNGAVIDSQPVIWANDLGDEKNAALLAYLRQLNRQQNRPELQAWRLEVGEDSEHLSPYEPCPSQHDTTAGDSA